MSKITVEEFSTAYPLDTIYDPMLYSKSTNLAILTGIYKENKDVEKEVNITVKLVVSGDPSIVYKGNRYCKPENYSEELINLIKENPLLWINDNDVYIENMNGFAFAIASTTKNKVERFELVPFMEDVRSLSTSELKEKMIQTAIETVEKDI